MREDGNELALEIYLFDFGESTLTIFTKKQA